MLLDVNGNGNWGENLKLFLQHARLIWHILGLENLRQMLSIESLVVYVVQNLLSIAFNPLIC